MGLEDTPDWSVVMVVGLLKRERERDVVMHWRSRGGACAPGSRDSKRRKKENEKEGKGGERKQGRREGSDRDDFPKNCMYP